MSYLRYLCYLANSGDQHIFCWFFCFVLFFLCFFFCVFVSLRLASCAWWCPTHSVLCFVLLSLS